jgi:hypothetical protein
MNLGFNWNAVPLWIWFLFIAALGAVAMLLIMSGVNALRRKGRILSKPPAVVEQIADEIRESEEQIAAFGTTSARPIESAE